MRSFVPPGRGVSDVQIWTGVRYICASLPDIRWLRAHIVMVFTLPRMYTQSVKLRGG